MTTRIDSRIERCDTSLIEDPIGEVATEVIDGTVVLYVYGEHFRIRLDAEKFATLRSVCHAVDVLYAGQGGEVR